MTDEDLWHALQALVKHGDSRSAAHVLGFSDNTLRSRIGRAKARWPDLLPSTGSNKPGWARHLHLPKKMPEGKAAATPEQADVEALARRRADDRVRELSETVQRLQQRCMALEDQKSSLLGMKEKALSPVKWTVGSKVMRGKTVLMPILFTSDFQCGEVIRADELDGLNAYNMDIFASRYNTLIETTVDISDHHTGPAEYPGIIYLRGGDAISGGIHEELRDTDDLSAVPAGQWLLRHEREGIRRLADRFKRVRVISIPGNHGRTTLRPRSKGYVKHNYETLLTWWLQTMFDNDSRVTFETPQSGDAWFEALGWNFLLAHGDRMGSRGGTGHIGPAATIARGHYRLFKNWSVTGRIPHYILTGHLHTSMKLELGYANGSLPGFNEYARDLGFTPAAPTQWLLYVHQRRGVSHGFEVQLADPPRRKTS